MEYFRSTGHKNQHLYDVNQVASILECNVSEIRSALTKSRTFFLRQTEILETNDETLFTEQGIYKLSMFVNSSVAMENREMMVTIGKIDRRWKNRIKAFKPDQY